MRHTPANHDARALLTSFESETSGRVHRLDPCMRKIPANLFDSRPFTLKLRAAQIGWYFWQYRYCGRSGRAQILVLEFLSQIKRSRLHGRDLPEGRLGLIARSPVRRIPS